MKKTYIIVGIIALIVVGIVIWYSSRPNTSIGPVVTDYKNATYTIDGQPVTLVNGYAETPAAPGSASKVVTQFFGNEATGDLNGDGLADTAFILTQNSGGSGTFFYVVAALVTGDGYKGTNAVLLGDRIAPQSTEIAGGKLIVNYADRNPDEPMTAAPSLGVTKYLNVQGGVLVEIPVATSTATTTSTGSTAAPGGRCGGNMLNAPVCGAGYQCAPTPGSHLPFGDVGGVCVKN